MGIVKEEARKLVEKLPEQASWDDLMYEIYVRKKVDEGLEAVKSGRVISHNEVKKRLLEK